MTSAIVLGTTYSGSGAVFDFLGGRSDAFAPLADAEYLLPHIPYGLMQLRSACTEAFHYTIAHEAILRFKDVAYRLARPAQKRNYGGDYENLLPGFSREIDGLIESLIDSRMPMRFMWDRISLDRPTEPSFAKLFGKDKSPRPVESLQRFLPKEPEFLTGRVCEMHDRLFRPPQGDFRFTLLNQAGSGWNPDLSTNFFSHRRVIVVTRDPRDQFAELKKFKGSSNVNEFTKWFRNLQKRSVMNNPEIMYLRFEDFVFDFQLSRGALISFLDLPEEASNYDPVASQKNVGRYRTELSAQEIDVIESELRGDCAHSYFDM